MRGAKHMGTIPRALITMKRGSTCSKASIIAARKWYCNDQLIYIHIHHMIYCIDTFPYISRSISFYKNSHKTNTCYKFAGCFIPIPYVISVAEIYDYLGTVLFLECLYQNRILAATSVWNPNGRMNVDEWANNDRRACCEVGTGFINDVYSIPCHLMRAKI